MPMRTPSGSVLTKVRQRIIASCVLLLLVLMLSLVACAGPTSAPASTPTPEPNPTPSRAPAAFQVAQLAINPTEVNLGVKAIITANVTNTGQTDGDYTAELKVSDVARASLPAFFYSEKVTIAAGASQLVSVLVSRNKPGIYKVIWDEITGEFTVVRPTEPSSPKITAPNPTTTPDFTSVDVVTNMTISLSQFKGSTVLLNFVNYGCDPSVNQIVGAQLLAIRELTEQRDDFVPLSVFCGCCPPDTLRSFAKENGLTWPWILDTDNSIVRQYADYLREYGYPTLIFIDKDQYIREVSGYCDAPTLSAKIDEI